METDFKKKKPLCLIYILKNGEIGEKAIVFFANIRKQYQYKIENHEKFSTEARMYHEMDLKYKMKCINKPIMICDYKADGYTKNIQKIFKENKVIRLHPSLLPAFDINEPVKSAFLAGVKVSGVTVCTLDKEGRNEKIIG